jgi:Flp pilus assembly protein TadB
MAEASAPRRPRPDLDAQGAARRLARGLLIALGVLIMLLGVLIAPLPGPGGLPVIAVGLMIVLRNSFWAKRRFVELSRRHPRTVYPMRRLMRPGAPVFGVLWHQMLKVERLIVPPKLRGLRRLRARTRRRGGRQTP